MKELKIAYLASEYPGISHTFIFREIKRLREMGMNIMTSSIRRPQHLERMTAQERDDAAQTLYIKDSSAGRIVSSILGLFFCAPFAFLGNAMATMALCRRNGVGLFKAAAYFIEAVILVRWMRENAIGHVHVHFANPAATVGMIASMFRGISFSVSVHGPDVFYNVRENMLADKVVRAKFIRCISHYCLSQLARLVPYEYWSKIHIVRCGIDPSVYRPRPDPENAIPRITCVGRLVPAKGQHILIQACSILKNKGLDIVLVFVGDGPDMSSLRRLAEDSGLRESVVFTGAIGQDKVLAEYGKTDVFALASFAEGVPVVLMEAMSMHIPCVSTSITGIPELIESGREGFLVPPADAGKLADRIAELIRNPGLAVEFGVNGREKVGREYNIDANTEQLKNLFLAELGKET